MKATDMLRDEHTIILTVLDALESIAGRQTWSGWLDLVSAGEALEFLEGFADRCHHAKEENHLFPMLASRGLSRLAVVLADHENGRALLDCMSRALAGARAKRSGAAEDFALAARIYVDLMRDHIEKENRMLFPMGDAMLSSDDQATLVQGFERLERVDMGAGVHERFRALAEELASRFGLAPAPAPARPNGCETHSACLP